MVVTAILSAILKTKLMGILSGIGPKVLCAEHWIRIPGGLITAVLKHGVYNIYKVQGVFVIFVLFFVNTSSDAVTYLSSCRVVQI